MWNDSKSAQQAAREEMEYLTGQERIARLSIEDILTVKGLFFIDQLDDADREEIIDVLTGRAILSSQRVGYYRNQLASHYDRQAKQREQDVVDAIVDRMETVGAA